MKWRNDTAYPIVIAGTVIRPGKTLVHDDGRDTATIVTAKSLAGLGHYADWSCECFACNAFWQGVQAARSDR